jgi:hypothetical protein
VRPSHPALFATMMIGVAVVGGCSSTGDFGRERPGLFDGDRAVTISQEAATAFGAVPSEFPFTDDERQLRDRAYVLIAPEDERGAWNKDWKRDWDDLWKPRDPKQGDQKQADPKQRDPKQRDPKQADQKQGDPKQRPKREAAPFDRAAYWNALGGATRRSEASAYARIATDLRNDLLQIEPFFEVAALVADTDIKRTEWLAHIRRSQKGESRGSSRRNSENAAVVALVCRALRERVVSYSYAVERLVVMRPSAAAVEPERLIGQLQARIDPYCPARTQEARRNRIVVKD